MFGLTKKSKPKFKLGMIVSLHHGQRYAVVRETFEHGRRLLFHVHYIDSQTGKLMVCPDSRCACSKPDGEINHACPIHGSNETEDRLVKFTDRDIEFYVGEGMIDVELAQAAISGAQDIFFGGKIYTPTDQQHLTADYIEREGKFYNPLFEDTAE